MDPVQYQAYGSSPDAYKDGLSPAVLAGNAGRDTHDQVRSRTKEEREEEKAAVKNSMDKAADVARKGSVSAKRAAAAVMGSVEGASGEGGIHQNFPVTRLDSGVGNGLSSGDSTVKRFLVVDNGVVRDQAFLTQ